MKRILVLSFYYHPDLSAGSFRCKALVDELAKTKSFVHVVTTTPNRYNSYKVEAEKSTRDNNVLIDRVPIPSHLSGMFDQINAFFAFYRGAKKLVEVNNYDLVFATSSRLFTAFLGAKIARKKRLPLYLDIRDLFVDTISNILPPVIVWMAKIVFLYIERYTFNSAIRINLVSGGFISYFKELYPNIPISLFTNGIDKEFIKASQADSTFQKPERTINILYAGNIGAGQGLHKVLPAMADKLKNKVNIKVIGSGGLIQELKDEVSRLCLDNIQIYPPVDRDTLIKEYNKTDVLFLHLNNYPAFKKVLPSKLFEYASISKPILAGLSGYSYTFAKTEIADCSLFFPTDINGALKAFSDINFDIQPREGFIKKYNREKIMRLMAEEILQFTRTHD
tara:strand:+ start:22898 stop:24076 length:1179 start_codon:yes stop_codon:yes gene_type:complete